MKYTANGQITVSLSITVDIPDEDLEGLSETEIKNLVEARAVESESGEPILCYQCSGGSESMTDDGSSFSLELDGEWQVTEVTPA